MQLSVDKLYLFFFKIKDYLYVNLALYDGNVFAKGAVKKQLKAACFYQIQNNLYKTMTHFPQLF
jgi:hypothetical protein